MRIMTLNLQLAMIIGALIALGIILHGAIKLRLNVKYAVVWICWALFILLLGIFPKIAQTMAQLLGIATVSNLVFLLMMAILYALSYYSYIKVSKMNEEIKRLGYEVAMLKKERDNEK
ncbi:MAG: DUF2304 domain-containing protein [Erysipelotrichaceae bacterium]|nr:DUF2304 domain-containing protein [Erysipelotrichaceae bacterium]